MKSFESFVKFLRKYYEKDEETDQLLWKFYLNGTMFSGMYPNMTKKYKILSLFLIFMHLTVSIFHIVVILRTCSVFRDLNFTLLSFEFQIYLLIQFCLLVMLSINTNRTEVRVLHREMIGEFYSYGEEHADILETLKKEMWEEKKKLLILPALLAFVAGNAILITPFIDSAYGVLGFNVSDTTLNMDVPIPIDYPFPTDTDASFYFFSFLQGITTLFIVSVIGSGALLFINVIQYFTFHLKYLTITIQRVEERAETAFNASGRMSFTKRSKELYDNKVFQKCYQDCLKKCFHHHQKILKWFENLSNFVSLPLGISYATGTVVIALSLLSIKTGTSLPGTAITSFLMCCLEVCFMALISVLGQRVADLSEDLRMSMYNIKWYCCSSSTKLDIQIFLEMSLRPMQLTGFGLVKANLDTFSNVMNSAYSYYNLIMAV